MIIVSSITKLRELHRDLKGSVGFVPTMGALHDGHLSLMAEAKKHTDTLIVSIFVNPTQFGPNEDLDTYPRDTEGDSNKCKLAGCDILFMPSVSEIYDVNAKTEVRVSSLTTNLCGATRPGHFDGVTTIVSKLFNIVQPDVAVFGKKDYQQLAVLRRMVKDLNFPIEIIGAPTIRESDGLAKSSRNLKLTPQYRKSAVALSQGLVKSHTVFQAGERSGAVLEKTVREHIEAAGLVPDYISCVEPDTLETYDGGERALIAIAIFAGDVRLIDNIELHEPSSI